MEYPCKIEERFAQPVVYIRGRSPVDELPKLFGRAYGAVGAYLGELGVQPAGVPYAAYHNMDMQDLDVSIGFPVAKALAGRGEIQVGEIAAGKYVTCLYTGPYSGLREPYAAIGRFVEQQALQPSGLVYEFYLNDPQATPPEQLETLILFELAGS